MTAQKYETIVARKHKGLAAIVVSIGFGVPTLIICGIAYAAQVNAALTALAFLLVGKIGLSLIAVYFLFLFGVVLWVQFIKRNRHDH
jgi:hypothetical protein